MKSEHSKIGSKTNGAKDREGVRTGNPRGIAGHIFLSEPVKRRKSEGRNSNEIFLVSVISKRTGGKQD